MLNVPLSSLYVAAESLQTCLALMAVTSCRGLSIHSFKHLSRSRVDEGQNGQNVRRVLQNAPRDSALVSLVLYRLHWPHYSR